MSFNMLLGAVLAVAMAQMLAELIQVEREARAHIQAAVMAQGQYAHLTARCQQSQQAAAAEEHVGMFRCETKLYWIVGASQWQDVCADLSGPKTAPLRWYMVATDCTAALQWPRFLHSPHQAQRDGPWRRWRITHWVAKS